MHLHIEAPIISPNGDEEGEEDGESGSIKESRWKDYRNQEQNSGEPEVRLGASRLEPDEWKGSYPGLT